MMTEVEIILPINSNALIWMQEAVKDLGIKLVPIERIGENVIQNGEPWTKVRVNSSHECDEDCWYGLNPKCTSGQDRLIEELITKLAEFVWRRQEFLTS